MEHNQYLLPAFATLQLQVDRSATIMRPRNTVIVPVSKHSNYIFPVVCVRSHSHTTLLSRSVEHSGVVLLLLLNHQLIVQQKAKKVIKIFHKSPCIHVSMYPLSSRITMHRHTEHVYGAVCYSELENRRSSLRFLSAAYGASLDIRERRKKRRRERADEEGVSHAS